MSGSLLTGCPIRKSTGHGIFAPNRGLSQLVTSFLASESLGIPHAPSVLSVISSRTEVRISSNLPPAFCLPRAGYPTQGARCSFLLRLSILRFRLLAVPPPKEDDTRFHHVNVLFLKVPLPVSPPARNIRLPQDFRDRDRNKNLRLSVSSSLYLFYLSAPERRCSSRTFRYGYLVTT